MATATTTIHSTNPECLDLPGALCDGESGSATSSYSSDTERSTSTSASASTTVDHTSSVPIGPTLAA